MEGGRIRGSRPSHKNISSSRKQLEPLNSKRQLAAATSAIKRNEDGSVGAASRFSKRRQSRPNKAPSEQDRINASKKNLRALGGAPVVQSEDASLQSMDGGQVALNSNGSIAQINEGEALDWEGAGSAEKIRSAAQEIEDGYE